MPAKEPEFLTRRRFLAALAASVVVAGATLPVGMSRETSIALIKVEWRELAPMEFKFKMVFADDASKQQFLEEGEISTDRFQLIRAA